MRTQVIHLHVDAPVKPAVGQPCNGCGVCCTWQPCPMGALIGLSLRGPCKALQWNEDARCYRCGMVQAPLTVLPWLPGRASAMLSRLARRWISQGSGCDCSLEAAQAASHR